LIILNVRHEHAISQDVVDPGVLRSPFWGQGVCRDPYCVYRCSRDDLVKGDREARRAGYAQALQVDNTIDTPAGVEFDSRDLRHLGWGLL